MTLSEQLTYATVLIRSQDKGNVISSGTGFIVAICEDHTNDTHIPILVTNKHVVENSIRAEITFCCSDADNNPIDTEKVSTIVERNEWIFHPEANIDLCCVPIARHIQSLEKKGKKPFYAYLSKTLIPNETEKTDFTAVEEVYMAGYPVGISDIHNNKPIVRRGITATHPNKDYQGEKKFLVDMACFPGSSGSPIVIMNQGAYSTPRGVTVGTRIHLLGVLYAGPQYSASGVLSFASVPTVPHPITPIPINLGIAIKAEKILDFEKCF